MENFLADFFILIYFSVLLMTIFFCEHFHYDRLKLFDMTLDLRPSYLLFQYLHPLCYVVTKEYLKHRYFIDLFRKMLAFSTWMELEAIFLQTNEV